MALDTLQPRGPPVIDHAALEGMTDADLLLRKLVRPDPVGRVW
jgi:hypothetical protein